MRAILIPKANDFDESADSDDEYNDMNESTAKKKKQKTWWR